MTAMDSCSWTLVHSCGLSSVGAEEGGPSIHRPQDPRALSSRLTQPHGIPSNPATNQGFLSLQVPTPGLMPSSSIQRTGRPGDPLPPTQGGWSGVLVSVRQGFCWGKKSCVVVAAYFHGVNAPPSADFKLPVPEQGAGKGCTQFRAQRKDLAGPWGEGAPAPAGFQFTLPRPGDWRSG